MAIPYHQRTHTCGQLRPEQIGQTVVLAGWVQNYRDHGGMVFIDLRDRDGLTQIKFNPETDPAAHEIAGRLRSEWVVTVRGDVAPRPDDMLNPKLDTGAIEVDGREIDVLSQADTPPFEITEHVEASEDLRLKYRFMDLRRKPMADAIIARHRITKATRDYFDRAGFLEIETPFLTRSTPEGARDYLVPSRVQQGHFYALPQSPQLFKQLFMIAGFDKYMQVVRCFRDEDLRADRQPEFTQIDMEMAFVQMDNVIEVTEGAVAHVMKEVLGVDIELPVPRITYDDAMRDYGSDSPDLRFGMTLKNVTEVAKQTDFKIFANGESIKCICVPDGAKMTRKETDGLAAEIQGIGAGGLPVAKVIEEGGKAVLSTGIAKFFAGDLPDKLIAAAEANVGDLICFAVGSDAETAKQLSWLRTTLAPRLGMVPEGEYNFCWVVDFPLLAWDDETQRWVATHHPFTAPRDEDMDKLESDPGKVRAKAYDLVLNGTEMGGGSIRIHQADIQDRIFRLLNINEQEARTKFGFLLDALRFGAPPHGGIALGLDRVVMLLLGLDSLREVVAFPKTQRAVCPLTQAPGTVDQAQLDELGIDLAPAVKAKMEEEVAE